MILVFITMVLMFALGFMLGRWHAFRDIALLRWSIEWDRIKARIKSRASRSKDVEEARRLRQEHRERMAHEQWNKEHQ